MLGFVKILDGVFGLLLGIIAGWYLSANDMRMFLFAIAVMALWSIAISVDKIADRLLKK